MNNTEINKAIQEALEAAAVHWDAEGEADRYTEGDYQFGKAEGLRLAAKIVANRLLQPKP